MMLWHASYLICIFVAGPPNILVSMTMKYVIPTSYKYIKLIFTWIFFFQCHVLIDKKNVNRVRYIEFFYCSLPLMYDL